MILKRLESLSKDEIDLLNECLKNNQQSIVKPLNDSVANSLCQKGLLIQANLGHMMSFPFLIPDVV